MDSVVNKADILMRKGALKFWGTLREVKIFVPF